MLETTAELGAPKKAGIVVLNYRNFADTIACLRTLLLSDYANAEIAVVDNQSGNDSLERIAEFLDETGVPYFRDEERAIRAARAQAEAVFLLQASSNRGYAAGNNVGIRLLLARGADYILLLNNDTLVDPGFLSPLVAYLNEHPAVGAVGPKITNAEGGIYWMCARRAPVVGDFFFRLGIGRKLFPRNHWVRRSTYEDTYDFSHPKQVEILSGSCMLIRADFLEATGLLDEHTFLYVEEVILYERLRAAGLTSVVVPTSTIVHNHARASASVPVPALEAAFEHSLRYYFTEYRGLKPWTVSVLMFLSRVPRSPFGRRAGPPS